MPEGDPALPPYLLRERAHLRVIQMLHVIATVEMEIDVHVIVLCQRKHPPNLPGAILS